MRNIALAIVVLAVTIPAMADVNITIDKDANMVTIGYECTASEEVRAFALDIDVNNGAYVVGSADFIGDPNTADYYVSPGSMTFIVATDSNTYIGDFGSPIAEEDPCGGVLEIASLYADSDPNHPAPPASSGDLCTFYFDCDQGTGIGTITLSENAKRGGVVLKDPNESVVVNLPAPLLICECEYPACWDYLTQCHGDASGDGDVKTADFFALRDSWYKTYPDPNYDPCADFNRDGEVKTADFFILRDNWYQTVPPDCTPGDINGIYCP